MKRCICRRQRGLGIVEMLVSLGVGLLVMLMACGLLLAASLSYRTQADAGRVDDNGRYALDLLARTVRQAAFVNWDTDTAPLLLQPEDSANLDGLDAVTISRNSDGISTPLPGAVNGSDALVVRYAGAGSGGDADGSVLNCGGFAVAAAMSPAARGWSIFYVATGSDGETELRCKYRGPTSWGADAIVRGVDTFQVLYGLDTDTPTDGVANRYLNASALNDLDAGLVLAGADADARQRDRNRQTYWKRVVSVRVALLLHGAQPSGTVATDGPPRVFDLFGREYAQLAAGGDAGTRFDEAAAPVTQRGKARQLLATTILLRNQAN